MIKPSLPPFKRWTLENFPFIEDDFDAITNYQLYCKIVEYIKSVDTYMQGVDSFLTEVENYFNNLDVQDEVNNKLDEMAEDGTLASLINEELFNQINDRIDDIEQSLTDRYIFIGDSYGARSTSWIDILKTKLGLNSTSGYKFAVGGAGFAHVGSLNKNFIQILQDNYNNVTDKDTITKIVVCGGYNDYLENYTAIVNAINSFCEYCKLNYPNAKIYIGMIGYTSAKTYDGTLVRKALNENVYPAYSYQFNKPNSPIYITNSEFLMRDASRYGDDSVHPNENGDYTIADGLFTFFQGGTLIVNKPPYVSNYTIFDITKQMSTYTYNDKKLIRLGSQIEYGNIPENTNIQCGIIGTSQTTGNIVGTYTNSYLFPNLSMDNIIPIDVSMICTQGNIHTKMYLNFDYDGSIRIFCLDRNENNQFINYTNITYFRINNMVNSEYMSILN